MKKMKFIVGVVFLLNAIFYGCIALAVVLGINYVIDNGVSNTIIETGIEIKRISNEIDKG